MPADTPTLEELLAILASAENPRATFIREDNSFPNSETAASITLSFTFRREKLNSMASGWGAADYVFAYPTKLFPEMLKQLELLREMLGLSSMMEDAYRFGDPKKSIEDAISFMEQELNQDTGSLGTLYTKQRREHFEATVKYLRELDRRRRESEARLDAARKRRAESERQNYERDRQREREEKHRKWEEEEAKKRRWQRERTTDSGYAKGSEEEKIWEAFRAAGGFENMRGANHFEDAMRAAAAEELRRRAREERKKSYDSDYKSRYEYTSGWNPFGNFDGQTSTPPPPPPPGKKKWYEILGCAAGADANTIRRAARKAASGLHPDKNKDPKAAERFKEISEAKAEGLQGL